MKPQYNRRLSVAETFLLFGALLFSGTAAAQTVAVTGATVHTAGPAGKIENATIIISDGRIAAVGAGVTTPAGAREIDASGKIITPGLVTPFGQIGLVEVNAVEGTVDYVQRGDQFSASFDPASAYNPRSSLVATNRIEGITHAIIAPEAQRPDDLGNQSRVFSGLASVVQLRDNDYMIRNGAALVANLGETGSEVAAGSRATALMVLRTALDDARDYGSNVQAFEQGNRRQYSLSRSDLETLQRLLRGDMPLLVRANRANDISAAIRLASDYEFDLIVMGGAEAWMVADELAAAGVSVILDSLANLPESFDQLNSRLDAASILANAGVRIAIGGDGANQNHNARNITQAAGIAVANGLAWDEALVAVTLAPAQMYGVGDRIGSLEAGKRADFVIWNDDPLELTSYPDQVFIGGEAVPMESRQTLLRDRYLDRASNKPPAFR
ncbi:MAG TPA: amidohydrolase family protein [Woeseiaceae bacterium]|nr:amidohydrolase family protein [Woeseiaceae bacterium]